MTRHPQPTSRRQPAVARLPASVLVETPLIKVSCLIALLRPPTPGAARLVVEVSKYHEEHSPPYSIPIASNLVTNSLA